MILFIHGFASLGLGMKSMALRDYFGTDQVLLPDLSHAPANAIGELEALLERYPVDLLVGSSLGGYYATWLNRQTSRPAVLINPAVAPFALLDDYLGEHTRPDGSRFDLTPQHLVDLRSLQRPALREEERYLVLLQSGDEVLDYRQAAAYYAAKDVVIEPGGDHRFQHFENHLPRIAAWREQNAKETQSLP